MLVTNGSMQADAFLFQLLVGPGDAVIVESPTYDRTLLNLRNRGADVRMVELETDGIDVDGVASLLEHPDFAPKLAHIIPNFQNPAGYTLSAEKRTRLLALAAEHDFTLFEDDPYMAIRFEGESLPTMLSQDEAGKVVYASSFSKTVCPGIRVGYLVGPQAVIKQIQGIATNTYISPNMVAQSIVNEFCRSGRIEHSIATVKDALRARKDALVDRARARAAGGEVRPAAGRLLHVGGDAGGLRRGGARGRGEGARRRVRQGHRLPHGGGREHAAPRLLGGYAGADRRGRHPPGGGGALARRRRLICEHHPYGDKHSQFGELFLPAGDGARSPSPSCSHGGFWKAQYGRKLMHPLCHDLVGRGWAAWNLEYRRLGRQSGGGWPATFDDLGAGIDHLRVLQAPLDLTRVITIGHSAGGHLAALAATRDGPSVQVTGVVSQAGVLDLERAWDWRLSNGVVRRLLGGTPEQHPERYAAASPAARLPLGVPALLTHGGKDDTVPPAMSEAFHRATGCDLVLLPDEDHYGAPRPGEPACGRRSSIGWPA